MAPKQQLTIRVDSDLYAELLAKKHSIEKETGRMIGFNAVIRELIKEAKRARRLANAAS